MSAELRSDWVCEDCSVRCYKMGGEPFPRPEGWVGDRCLRCARADEEPHDKARRMLKEGRAPSRVCVKGVSKRWMKECQEELIEAGELDPDKIKKVTPADKPKPKPKPKAPPTGPRKQPLAESLLREDPELSNKEIASRVGVHKGTVGKARRRLGIEDSRALRRAAARRVIEASPGLTDYEVKARLKHPVTAPVLRELRAEVAAGDQP
jgi:hypothetical protein